MLLATGTTAYCALSTGCWRHDRHWQQNRQNGRELQGTIRKQLLFIFHQLYLLEHVTFFLFR